MSNKEFAELLGMSRQTVGFYLNGDRIPDALGILRIAEKCNVSADWLLGLSDIATPRKSETPSALDKLNIVLSRQDAENLSLLCDNMNYFSVGAALAHTKDHNEQQINDVWRSFCHLGYAIVEKLNK